MKRKPYKPLSPDTIIEVIRIRADEVIKKEMTISQWEGLKKQPNCRYSAYQKGFSQFKINDKR